MHGWKKWRNKRSVVRQIEQTANISPWSFYWRGRKEPLEKLGVCLIFFWSCFSQKNRSRTVYNKFEHEKNICTQYNTALWSNKSSLAMVIIDASKQRCPPCSILTDSFGIFGRLSVAGCSGHESGHGGGWGRGSHFQEEEWRCMLWDLHGIFLESTWKGLAQL